MKRLRLLIVCLIALALLSFEVLLPAAAHPMGNFSINHYARFTAENGKLALRYVLDMAEIPTVTEQSRMDSDFDGRISEHERITYLASEIQDLRSRLSLSVGNLPLQWRESGAKLEFKPGAGGLNTMRLTFTLTTPLPALDRDGLRVIYKDANFVERTGWKEIVATCDAGTELLRCTASRTDSSRELSAYPADPGVTPPQQAEAEFTIVAADAARFGAVVSEALPVPSVAPAVAGRRRAPAQTPQDGFTQAISRRKLTTQVILISLCLAFGFGALHALSPGHGKAMVAAYLVGTRGTIRHAAFLGGVITLTHTISVFALGLFTLAAAQYVVPERLYPGLSIGAGLLIVCVGVALLRQRIAYGAAQSDERAESYDGIENQRDEDSEEAVGSPLPEHMPVSLRSLIVLGVTGGALPCPSALVVMLGAISLHRIAFGMALIGVFSLGLASVLTGIGILVVKLRGVLDHLPLHRRFTSRLSLLSAVLVTLLGISLVVRALNGQP